jgi:hypothetical protein
VTAQRGTWWLGAGLLASLAGASCRVPYAPVTPHAASTDGISASVVRVGEESLGRPLLLVQVKFAGGDAPAIGDAWLAPRDSPPCQTGVRAVGVRPDVWFAWPDVREMEFPGPEVDQSGLMAAVPTVIDLDILPSSLAGERRCLRLPVAEAQPAPEWTARSRGFFGAGFQLVRPRGGAYGDVGDGFLADLHGGVWVGPARLRLDWLFGESRTPRPPPAGYDSISAQLLGGALSLELFPIRAGRFGLGLNAGYEWLFTDFHATMNRNETDEYRFRGPRGPRVMLRLARVPPPPRWPGFSNRKDGWAISLDLIAARWSGLGPPPATVVGIGMSLDTGYWW